MSNWVKGFDLSFSKLTPENIREFIADGARVVGQCLWTGAVSPKWASNNVQVSLDAGLVVIGYISVNGVQSGLYHVNQGKAALTDEQWGRLALVPIDVELHAPEDGGIPGDECIQEALDRAEFLTHLHPCIYTGRWYWPTYKGSYEFSAAGVRLWTADADGDPDIDYQNPEKQYCGWTMEHLVGEQFTGGQPAHGCDVDWDMFDLDKLVKEEPVTLEELEAEVVKVRADMEAGLGMLVAKLAFDVQDAEGLCAKRNADLSHLLYSHGNDTTKHIDSKFLDNLDATYAKLGR